MKKASLFVLILGLVYHPLLAQNAPVNDGPYVFIENQQLISKSVKDGAVLEQQLESDAYDTSFNVSPSIYQKIEKIVALSDIHGQYDLAVEILQNNQIIDEELNWSFGKGHLVIVGDIFDRGGKVTEVLWLIYKLEKQAQKAGGNLHYLLGNHEYMVLHKDLRYLHEKYPRVSKLLGLSYDALYGHNTILGRWLRSKHTIIKINQHVFVHGGISNEFIDKVGFDIEWINQTMRESIDRTKDEMKSTDFYSTYYGSSGPIWYRGYFYGNLSDQAIDSVLNRTSSDHLIVGHCSNEEVVSLFNHKIFGVDSSIKNGQYGEVLFLSGDRYYRGTREGNKIKLN